MYLALKFTYLLRITTYILVCNLFPVTLPSKVGKKRCIYKLIIYIFVDHTIQIFRLCGANLWPEPRIRCHGVFHCIKTQIILFYVLRTLTFCLPIMVIIGLYPLRLGHFPLSIFISLMSMGQGNLLKNIICMVFFMVWWQTTRWIAWW